MVHYLSKTEVILAHIFQAGRNFWQFIKNHQQWAIVLVIVVGLAVVGGVGALQHNVNQPISHTQINHLHSGAYDAFLQETGNSLINLHEDDNGGWRFRSRIQTPHFQTDRDVGAAGIGVGFLALADKYPDDPRWLHAAKQTASWLIAVSSSDNAGGRFWHDYVDDGQVSADVYTSFDDGTIGISDFFWQLYEKTHDQQYKQMSLEGLQWTFSQAEAVNQDGLSGYRWKWDVTDPSSP